MPGDNVEFTVELIHPIAIENGTKFSIREGGRTVGAGNVTEIIELYSKKMIYAYIAFFYQITLFVN